MAEKSDEVFCTNCRAVISKEVPYCPECGEKQNHAVRSDTSEEDTGTYLSVNEEYCINCGEIISAGTPYCPECGKQQNHYDNNSSSENTNSDTIDTRSWIIGCKSGSTLRNAAVGLLYILFYPFGIPLLLYSYLTRKRGWSNRKVGKGIGVVLLVFIIAVAAIGAVAPPAPTDENADSSASSPNVEKANDGSTEVTEAPSESLDVAVRIEYPGDWSGAMSIMYDDESESRSISGSGTDTISIDGAPEQICANSQKQSGGSSTLVIQIIEDGEVISQSDTSSEYGVAQTCSEIDDFI